jgi:hypothetical protein
MHDVVNCKDGHFTKEEILLRVKCCTKASTWGEDRLPRERNLEEAGGASADRDRHCAPPLGVDPGSLQRMRRRAAQYAARRQEHGCSFETGHRLIVRSPPWSGDTDGRWHKPFTENTLILLHISHPSPFPFPGGGVEDRRRVRLPRFAVTRCDFSGSW